MTLEEFYEKFWEFRDLRKNLPEVKLIKSYIDKRNKSEALLTVLNRVGNNDSVLDIGAGDKKIKASLQEVNFQGIYHSMDIETTHIHDFNSLEDIDLEYDSIFMFELIEHLQLETFIRYIEKIYKLLKKGGKLIISTPNIDHINALWRSNITHIRQYPIRDLYAILRLMNFKGEINLYRVYHRPYRHTIKSKTKERLKIIISNIMGVDYASSIMIIACK